MSMEAALQVTQNRETQSAAYEIAQHAQTVVEAARSITSKLSKQIALVSISLQFDGEYRIMPGRQERSVLPSEPSQLERSARYLLDNLRPLVRKTDVVFLHIHTFHFILLDATLPVGKIVHERLWDALLWRVHNPYDAEMLRPCSISAGYSAYPASSSSIEQCFREAGAAQSRIELPSRRALAQQRRTLKETDLQSLAQRLGVPYLPLLPRKSPEQVKQLVNPRLVQELRCYPLGCERGVLTVAVADPQDSATLDRLQQETGLHIFPVLATSGELQTVLDQLI